MTAPADTIADRYVLLRLSGMSDGDAAREAGYSSNAPSEARRRYCAARSALKRTPDIEEALKWATKARARAEEQLASAKQMESLLRLLMKMEG